MPTAQDLDRLKTAMAKLSGLAAARGELIRADDWNALVDIVVDLGRAILARDDAATVPPHEHLDQVTAEWLAPALRAQVERGPLSDPAQSTRLSALELALKRLGDKGDEHRTLATDLRARFDEIATRDLERQTAVTRLTRTVDKVSDPAPELDAMRASLKSVQDNITKVIDTASQLRDAAGAPIDLAALRDRVGAIDQLTQRLRGGDGQVLDFAGLENKLAAIAEKSVTQDQLTQAIRNARNARPAALGALEAQLTAELTTRFDGRFVTLKDELAANVDTRLSGIDALVDTRVAGALPTVREGLAGALDARAAQIKTAAVAEALAGADRTATTRADALRAEFATSLASASETTRGLVQAEVGRRVAADLQATRGDLANANARIEAFAQGIAAVQSDRASFSASLAAVPQQLATLRAELRDTLIGEATTRANATLAEVNTRLATLSQQQQQVFSAMSRQIEQGALDAARAAAADAVQSGIKAARVSILAEVRGIAREEVGVSARDRAVLTGGTISDTGLSGTPLGRFGGGGLVRPGPG